MNSVVVFRHAESDGPGYFATFLERNDIPWRLVKLDEGEPVPTDPCAWSGVALLGGPMSVNDELPWIAPELDFVRQAVASGVPIIGHCLGGQLMSKALGGVVLPNPVQEIGWGQVDVLQHKVAREWLGNLECFESFHWHGETFSIPPRALRFASSKYCANQMYALGPHIGMQFHVEMTSALIEAWCRVWSKKIEVLAQFTPSIQTQDEMLDRVEEKVRALNLVADRIYTQWIKVLKR